MRAPCWAQSAAAHSPASSRTRQCARMSHAVADAHASSGREAAVAGASSTRHRRAQQRLWSGRSRATEDGGSSSREPCVRAGCQKGCPCRAASAAGSCRAERIRARRAQRASPRTVGLATPSDTTRARDAVAGARPGARSGRAQAADRNADDQRCGARSAGWVARVASAQASRRSKASPQASHRCRTPSRTAPAGRAPWRSPCRAVPAARGTPRAGQCPGAAPRRPLSPGMPP